MGRTLKILGCGFALALVGAAVMVLWAYRGMRLAKARLPDGERAVAALLPEITREWDSAAVRARTEPGVPDSVFSRDWMPWLAPARRALGRASVVHGCSSDGSYRFWQPHIFSAAPERRVYAGFDCGADFAPGYRTIKIYAVDYQDKWYLTGFRLPPRDLLR